MKNIRLPHKAIVKAPGLLPMLYKPSELAAELDVPVSTLKDWLHSGVTTFDETRIHLFIDRNYFNSL